MITITNSVFDAKGEDKKAKVFGITLSGSEDVTLKDCAFKNTGYAGILNNCTGKVVVEDCSFECDNIYNPIEGGQSVDNGDVVVKGCSFTGTPGNNFINFYQFADGSKHEVIGCNFTPTTDNNVIRISNRESAKADFLVKDCEYTFTSGEPSAYTGFLLCQDYTNKSGKKQDFTGIKVTLDNVKCNGDVITADGASEGCVYYVYTDGTGIITGQDNDPVVIIK